MLEKTANHSETDILAESSEFTKLVRKSLKDIRLNKVAPWKEVWDELWCLSDRNFSKTLKKKYRNIKDDIIEIVRKSEDDPTIGDQIPGWNKEVWKIRVASSDMKRDKRGGFRLIYLWKEHERRVYLLAIYFKGEKEMMTSKEMENLLRKVNRELEEK